ncbi:MAG: hypothetical protein KDB27_28100 [Planctomycetales bacterium]|nr:hypothetical protein [Planctomycetales bacterium]
MTPEEIELVQKTWASVSRNADAVAELFYQRLFQLDPKLRSLFTSNMIEQGRKLTQMISVAVNNLNQLDEILDAVKDLGVRHVSYNVSESDYDTVGEALLWTLEKGLGSDFTPEAKAAWTETYSTLASVMKDAAAAVV